MPGFEVFGKEEREEVNDVLESGVLMRYGFEAMRNGHFKAKEFESRFAELMKSKYAQLTSSGTSALTVALASAGIGAGDEIIIPTFTFVASFESILALGAIPVLCDVDDTLCLDPKAVEKAISPKTKAVMPVHMCGSMADLSGLKNLCEKYGLLLIEDASQALGAKYQDIYVGNYGDLGCFSFDFVKTITCGEGGAVITNNKKFAENADKYQDHGHDHFGKDRGAETHPFMGYNYRISELHAAVGLGQLKKFDQIIAKQQENFKILRKVLGRIPEVEFRRVPKGGMESGAFLSFFIPNEELARKTISAISEAGIDSCFYWYDNNWHFYRKWEHLLEKKTLGPLSSEIKSQNFGKIDFSQSDHWLGRTVSCLIKIGWTETEMKTRAEKIANAITTALS